MTKSGDPTTGHSGVAWSVGLGLLSAWLAAGSLGILAVSLQATLSWLLLLAAVLCRASQFRPVGGSRAGAIVVLAVLPAAVAPVRHGLTLTVAAVMCLLSAGMAGVARRLMLIGSLAV